MSFRKIVSAIAAACVLTGSMALGTTDAFAAAPKPAAHKEIACKPGLVAHQVKAGGKLVWKCGKPAAKKAVAKPVAKKAPAKAKTVKPKTKASPKKAKKLVCKTGLVAHPVKVNGKTVWKCGKPAPKKPAAKTKAAVKAPVKKAAVKVPAKKAAPKKVTKLTCKKGSTAKKVKKNGKWVWECFKAKPAAPAKK